MKRKFKLARFKGFSLIEIILAAVILGGFVHAALIMSSQILTTRAEGSFEIGRRNWAALEARLAVDGVEPQNVLSGMSAPPATSLSGRYNLASVTSSTNTTIQSGGSLDILPFNYCNNVQVGRNNCRTGMFLNASAVPADPAASELGIKVTLSFQGGKEDIVIDSKDVDPENITGITIDCASEIDWPEDGSAPRMYAMVEQTAMGASGGYQLKFGYGSTGNIIPENDWHNIIVSELLNVTGDSDSPTYEVNLHVLADSTGYYLDSPTLKIPLTFTKLQPNVEFTRTISDSNTVKIDDVIESLNAGPSENVMQKIIAANIPQNNLKTLIKGPSSEMTELPEYLNNKFTAKNKLGSIELEDIDEDPNTIISVMEFNHFNNQSDYTRSLELISYSFLLQGIELSEPLTIETTSLPTVNFDPASGSAVDSSQPVSLTLSRTGLFETIQDFENEFYDLRYTTDGTEPNGTYSDVYESPINIASFFVNDAGTINAQVFADKRNEIKKFITTPAMSTASYTMISDDGVWRWIGDGGGSASWSQYNSGNSVYGTTKWADPDKYPAGAEGEYYQSGLDKTVLFGSAPTTTDINFSGYPDNIADPVLSHVIFDKDSVSNNADYTYKINSDNTTITLDSSTERSSIEVRDGNHQLNIPIEVERTVKISVAEDSTLEINKSIKQTNSTNNEGVIKLGTGVLKLGQNSSTDNLLDFLVQEGTLQINGSNKMEAESTLTLDGGIFDLNNWNQDFSTGLDVTSVSYLDFGDADSHQNDFYSKNIYIDSDSVLVIKNWQEDAQNNQSKNEFITEEYPGVRVLNRVQFENANEIGAKWRVTNGGGEIIPKTGSVSSGLAYISVSEDSEIRFNDTDGQGCKLSIEGLHVLEGKTLTIHGFSNNEDIFYCLTKPDGENVTTGKRKNKVTTYTLTGVIYDDGSKATWDESSLQITRIE